MISSSDDESPRVQGKTIVLGVLGVTLFLGALYMCFPMSGFSSAHSAELQGKSDLWSLSIPSELKDAYNSVKEGVESVHKGVNDQVWQTQHQEMMETFNKYDVNSDGKIDRDELVTWVFGPKNADSDEVKKSVKCFIEKFGSKEGELSPQEMYYVFAPIIKSTDGYLSKIGC